MKKTALTKIQLDLIAAGGCATPGCKHEDHGTLYLHQRCHPEAPIEVSYTIRTGIIRVACFACKRPIADIKVAE